MLCRREHGEGPGLGAIGLAARRLETAGVSCGNATLPALTATAGLLPAHLNTACILAGSEVQCPTNLTGKSPTTSLLAPLTASGRCAVARSSHLGPPFARSSWTQSRRLTKSASWQPRNGNFGELMRPGRENRPAWMDIRLDSPEDLPALEISIQPVVLKSLLDAGFRCLGDLRWVSSRELRRLHYVGIKNAQQLRDVLRRMEHGGGSGLGGGWRPRPRKRHQLARFDEQLLRRVPGQP
jgi:hypothetical protein